MACIVREGDGGWGDGGVDLRAPFSPLERRKSTPSFEAAENELTVLALALKDSGRA